MVRVQESWSAGVCVRDAARAMDTPGGPNGRRRRVGGERRRVYGEYPARFRKELLSLGLEERHREAGGAGGDASGAEVDNDVEDEVDELVQSLYHLSPNRPHSYQ